VARLWRRSRGDNNVGHGGSEVRRSVRAQDVAGDLLKSSATTEPLGLVPDLRSALDYALWTGVVVVVFVQILPEPKRRQLKEAL
jgi:hypothetical protein